MKADSQNTKNRSGVTKLNEKIRMRNENSVLKELKSGPLTRAELGRKTGLCDSTIWRTIGNLMDAGRVRMGTEIVKPARGKLSVTFELGASNTEPRKADDHCQIYRHPQDVWMFGECAPVKSNIQGRVHRLIDDELEAA